MNQFTANEEKMRPIAASFIDDESAVTSIEYALLASLVAVAIVVSVGKLGTGLSALFGTVRGALTSTS